MKRLILVVGAVLVTALSALSTGLHHARAAALPAATDLAAATLTARDIGAGFTTAQSGPSDELTTRGIPNHVAAFMRQAPLRREIESVVVLLADATAAEAVGGEVALQDLPELRQLNATLEPAEAPEIGAAAQRFRFTIDVLGMRLNGDVVIWRQQDVLAMVMTLGTNPASDAVPYAILQQEKLVTVFGP